MRASDARRGRWAEQELERVVTFLGGLAVDAEGE
jgi:hypothetical protein